MGALFLFNNGIHSREAAHGTVACTTLPARRQINQKIAACPIQIVSLNEPQFRWDAGDVKAVVRLVFDIRTRNGEEGN